MYGQNLCVSRSPALAYRRAEPHRQCLLSCRSLLAHPSGLIHGSQLKPNWLGIKDRIAVMLGTSQASFCISVHRLTKGIQGICHSVTKSLYAHSLSSNCLGLL